jgi:hypothetical protein
VRAEQLYRTFEEMKLSGSGQPAGRPLKQNTSKRTNPTTLHIASVPSKIMSLAQQLGDLRSKQLYTYRINDALRNHNVEEIAQFIRSSEDFDEFDLNCPPVNEELGRHISDAIVQNSHIRTLSFRVLHGSTVIRDIVAWIGSRNTLFNMMSLESVVVIPHHDMSVLDCSALFPLLLTSTSLHSFEIYFFNKGCTDDVMSALLSYLGTASLREFKFFTYRLSVAAFTDLCNGVALSTVREFTLSLTDHSPEFNPEPLARIIVESSLEEVTIDPGVTTWSESFISALKLTAPVRNMDFTFTQIGDYNVHLRISRKWKPLVSSANTPLALWPHILEKSHASPETSHGSADIVFYVLRQKPDLVPAP